MEVLAVRSNKEEIEKDKKAKNERRQAKQDKKANEQTAAIEVAKFENQMALVDRAQEAKFPRRQPEST